MENKTVKFELINYFDVWASDEKGSWEVNNLCSEGFIEVPENATNKDLVKALKEHGFFKKHVRMNMLDIIEDMGDCVEFFQRKNNYPICRLELKN